MSTTTLRLNDDLKRRVTELAQRAGKSPHTFMLEAIAEKADSEEAKQDFHFQAGERLSKLAATGETVSWSEMREYLRKRAHGERPDMPQDRKMRDLWYSSSLSLSYKKTSSAS